MITTDALVEGVHFLPDDPPELVARKLLRVNLSDLAAKAAEPFAYFLAVAWPAAWDGAARAAFAAGLAQDQVAFGLKLLGGDTVSTPGPMTASVTALGYAPEGGAIRRSGAGPGEDIYVTGAIGDGRLGLAAARGRLSNLGEHAAALADRYRLPQPRVELREFLRSVASASIDVSDGLVADLGHLCRASGVGAEIELGALPLSPGGRAWLAGEADRAGALTWLATGGDDYELLFTAAGPFPETPGVTRIGHTAPGAGVQVLHEGVPVPVERTGWRHG